MSGKKCEKVMNSFFELDKGEHLKLLDSFHLLFCKDCRTKVRLLTKAESLALEPLKLSIFNSKKDFMHSLKSASPQWFTNLKPVSMLSWVFSGLVMMLFFVLSGFFLSKTQNQTYLFWFYMIFAGFVTAYCAAFIAVNMDFFIKKIDTKKLHNVALHE
ncbi:hypothetical protein [Treponema pectinovorum]|uniref:hypothetical protein n=1 Tax=Treponema pectinovorum TaxID=164 RepID=UPI003D8A347A